MTSRAGYIAGIITSWVVFAVTVFFNALAATDTGQDWGIFNERTGNISDKYPTQITPSGWAFSIWGAIYVWTILWLVYACTTFCRKEYDGELIFESIPFIPAGMYFTFAVSNAANIGWLFAWDNEELIASACLLPVLPIFLAVSLILACRGLAANYIDMNKNSLGADVWMDRILVQNGLGAYLAWTSIASLINLAVTLQHEADMNGDDAATICLGILSGILLWYFLTDTISLDRYTRYLITPYVVVPYALAAVLDNNWDPEARNWMFSMALFAASVAFFLSKLIVMAYRICTTPYADVVFVPTTQVMERRNDYTNME
jgi:hypothetical protein